MSVRQIKRSALVRFSPEQMFDLVADFERYPEFLPWVTAASIVRDESGAMIGSIEMRRNGMSERFSTRNEFDRPRSLRMRLVEGPFRSLDGRWSFAPVGDLGTQIELDMRFEFANPVVGWLFGRSFEQSCASLVDAFVERARRCHGQP